PAPTFSRACGTERIETSFDASARGNSVGPGARTFLSAAVSDSGAAVGTARMVDRSDVAADKNVRAPGSAGVTISRTGFATHSGIGSHSPRLLSISRTRLRTWRARSASVLNPQGTSG